MASLSERWAELVDQVGASESPNGIRFLLQEYLEDEIEPGWSSYRTGPVVFYADGETAELSDTTTMIEFYVTEDLTRDAEFPYPWVVDEHKAVVSEPQSGFRVMFQVTPPVLFEEWEAVS